MIYAIISKNLNIITMKTSILHILCCAIFLGAFYSCKKKDVIVLPGGDKLWRIEKFSAASGSQSEFNFHYNTKGNPVFITSVGFGRRQFEFMYDTKDRLVDFIEISPEFGRSFSIWHKYVYDSKDRVIIDSIFKDFDIINNRPFKARVKTVDYLEYDAKDRIIRTYKKDKAGVEQNITVYTYNNYGNRTDIASVYDTKMNIHRTHKVWQLIDRDYSINNPLGIMEYNSYNAFGLPVELHPLKIPEYHFLTIGYNFLTVQYSFN
jgi:hypothetical protein